jgi:hypothetical protein
VLDNVNPDVSDSEFIEQDDGLEVQLPEAIPSPVMQGYLVGRPTTMRVVKKVKKVRQTVTSMRSLPQSSIANSRERTMMRTRTMKHCRHVSS